MNVKFPWQFYRRINQRNLINVVKCTYLFKISSLISCFYNFFFSVFVRKYNKCMCVCVYIYKVTVLRFPIFHLSFLIIIKKFTKKAMGNLTTLLSLLSTISPIYYTINYNRKTLEIIMLVIGIDA